MDYFLEICMPYSKIAAAAHHLKKIKEIAKGKPCDEALSDISYYIARAEAHAKRQVNALVYNALIDIMNDDSNDMGLIKNIAKTTINRITK